MTYVMRVCVQKHVLAFTGLGTIVGLDDTKVRQQLSAQIVVVALMDILVTFSKAFLLQHYLPLLHHLHQILHRLPLRHCHHYHRLPVYQQAILALESVLKIQFVILFVVPMEKFVLHQVQLASLQLVCSVLRVMHGED